MRDGLKILFLSGLDSSLSWMAGELFRSMYSGNAQSSSFTLGSELIAPEAVASLREIGLEPSSEGCRMPRKDTNPIVDLILALDDQAREYCKNGRLAIEVDGGRRPHFGMPIVVFWPAAEGEPNVAGSSASIYYRHVRDRLQRQLAAFINHGYLAALSTLHEETRRLIDSLKDGIIMHDTARRISVFNRAAERITGFRREEVLGRDCHTVFGHDGICGGQCLFDPRADQPIDACEYQVSFPAKNGEDKLLHMSVTPLGAGENQPEGVLVVLRDITEVSELRRQVEEKFSFHGMVGVSPAMREVFKTIRQVVTSDYPVLITGESGTGKELAAHAIHNESRRRGGPFVPVNCGALPENILESELFGHVRGAFTGAIRDKKGRFELADGGTLFLDEVAELTPAFQVKLLRVLQEQQFERVGGEQPITVDVRIICATNRSLRELVKAGKFREDLFYRLAVVPVVLPPLRERREDILPLVEQIMVDIRRETGNKNLRVADETIEQLLRHDWPGNVRELINALRFSAVRCAGKNIHVHHLPPEIRQAQYAHEVPAIDREAVDHLPFAGVRRRNKLDPVAVKTALAQAGGNKLRAAKILGVGRATLYRFLTHFPELH